MENLPDIKTMYEAFVKRDASFEGIFFTGVKTTGIFCRPSCPARKPALSNIEFFPSAKDALLSGYRPCKRCSPMQPSGETPDWINKLFDEINSGELIRWKDSDLKAGNFNPYRVRRWFKKNHNMTFHAYMRSIRLGNAINDLKQKNDLTQTAYKHGYESISGFRDALKKLTGISAGKSGTNPVVHLEKITTPLGPMLAGATAEGLCLLEFTDRRMLNTQLKILSKRLNCSYVYGSNKIINILKNELNAYFKGRLKSFSTPLFMTGTDFQKKVWQNLLKIPSGKTISYEQLAVKIGKPSAIRAAAKANGDNKISLLIPCHRVIGKNGDLTGYGGGLWRKKYLLDLELKHEPEFK